MVAEAGRALTRAGAVRLAQSYVAAYNDRDLDAMLALQDEHIVSYPVRMFGHRSLTGHAGVRAWWESMGGQRSLVRSRRGRDPAVLPDRAAILGEIRDQGELVSPWGVVVRIRNGLIIESRSYLSDKEVLDELGLLENPRRG